jgi:anti-anti-sigma factor
VIFLPNPRGPGAPPGRTLLALPPEIDGDNAAGLFVLIIRATQGRAPRPGVLVLDLTGIHFMDSQGVRLVGDLRRRLQPRIPVRVVAAPGGVVSRVLEVTGLRRDIPVYDTLAEALAS